ncbi:hypothetical protein [Paramagnetospirillum magneticum]|nr:hypothetical protein [Paramagnetospirillum magneticum]
MSKTRLAAAIEAALRDEARYAARLQERGDFGLAKLALAAIAEIRTAVNASAAGDDQTHAARLGTALETARVGYLSLWEDEDGIGTSTFLRIRDLVDTAT